MKKLLILFSIFYLWVGIAVAGTSEVGGFPKIPADNSVTNIKFTDDTLSAANVIFVESSSGNDSFDGLSPAKAKKTITGALSLFAPTGADQHTVYVLDAGTYSESFTVPQNIKVNAPYATVVGSVVLRAASYFKCYNHKAHDNDAVMLEKIDSLHSYYIVSGSNSNGFTGVTNIRNSDTDSILFADVEYMNTSFRGIQDVADNTTQIGGHIHFNLKDMYLSGNDTVGIYASSENSDLTGQIDHIKMIDDGGTNKTAVYSANGSNVELYCGEILLEGHTAYEVVGSGSLMLNCMKISGARLGYATTVMHSDITYTKQNVDDALAGLANDLTFGNRIYYCGTDTQDVGAITYGLFSEVRPPVETTVAIGPITTSVYAQYTPGRGRVTPELGVSVIPSGVYNRVAFHANSDSAGRHIELQYRYWLVDSSDVFISAIATSTVGIAMAYGAGTIQRMDVSFSLDSDIVIDPTYRIVEEMWWRRTGVLTGTNPTITRYIGGIYAGFFALNLPGNVVMLTSGLNASMQVTFPGDLDVDTIKNVPVINAVQKDVIASITENMMTWSGSLASGATSLATTKKFDSGILFVGGLIYDLADATVVTLNQAGVNTVIEFASPIVGDKLCVLLILK